MKYRYNVACIAAADPGFAKGGTMASARSASLNGGLGVWGSGAEPPAGSKAQTLVGSQGKLKSFLYIFI